ncbi:MAG: GerMN domain-containing protein [Treponema sp.]|jgi:hypothetical protein|nr:GerMN domain-containing protein [Treponema sp.]
MALRKAAAPKAPDKKTTYSGPKKSGGRKPWALIFWVVFFLVIFILFLINRDQIRQTLKDTQFVDRLLNRQVTDTTVEPLPLPVPDQGGDSPEAEEPESPEPPQVQPEPAAAPPAGPAVETEPAVPRDVRSPLPESRPAPPAPQPPAAPAPEVSGPPAQTPPGTASGTGQRPQTDFRERNLYFIQVDTDGLILRTRVTRQFPVSDSPLLDVIEALVNGPNAEEQSRGLISLIPRETKILNLTVRGSTAYISFSEDFQFITSGVEGYAGALRQVVWTATEFPNVQDVQILIEGRRVDYLGEVIWIGSPVNRDMR